MRRWFHVERLHLHQSYTGNTSSNTTGAWWAPRRRHRGRHHRSGDGGRPRVAALIGAGIGGLTGAAIGKYMDQQEAELRAQLQGSGVSVTRVGNQIILNMPSNITFAVDSDKVQPQFNETLVSVGLVLRKFNKTIIDVYGPPTRRLRAVQQGAEPARRRGGGDHPRQPGADQRRFFIEGRGESDPTLERDRIRPRPEPPRRDPALPDPGLTARRAAPRGPAFTS